jgi:AraC-like DNA-binding protein
MDSLNVNQEMIGTLERAFAARQLSARPAYTHCGLEALTQGDSYYWDGMRRGGNAAHPYLVLQYTLQGWGAYATEKQTSRIPPGTMFCAYVPSPHRYYLPSESADWSYFWLIVNHPYIVERIARRTDDTGAVFPLDIHEPLFDQMVSLFTEVCQNRFDDEFAEEQALFAFMLEYERYGVRTRYRQPERDTLLAETREHILRVLDRPVGVAELGAARGMSRTAFTHHFKSITRLSPADYVRSVRLEEAALRLLHTDYTLEQIARETGFADANHFCKAFRRAYHLSPGQYRRHMGVRNRARSGDDSGD